MTVVGTAGHVDHGKSTLLLALSGRDPDRWDEEKRRGLTIDLGFVWATLPSGREVSFVDVPGHERFVKNMLAGVDAVDVALLVVAADEGWMPQSEEHLAILDLLGMDRAVVALTKIDRVDSELIELAGLEILEKLEGTSLEGSEIVPVSATTGEGLEALASALDATAPHETPGDEPRLWIDRRFTVAGAGSVVTGTLRGGSLSTGDTLEVHPDGGTGRIRSIESHERALDEVLPRRRVALNLTGISETVGRGHMLGAEGRWLDTTRFVARVRPARYADEIGQRGAFHLHIGTAAVPARIRLLGEGVLIDVDRPLALRYGDRFILRDTGRRAVVAGGDVLDPSPPRRGRLLRAAATLPSGLSPAEAANALLELRESETHRRLVAHTGADPTTGTTIGEEVVTPAFIDRLSARAAEKVEAFHRATPLRPGLPTATLTSRLGVSPGLAAEAVARAYGLAQDGSVVWMEGRSGSLDAEQDAAWARVRKQLEAAGLQPPRVQELELDREVLHSLVRSGELVLISEELAYLPGQAETLRNGIAAMPADFTVADFRDALGISRKYAVPILEWADAQGLTRRRGDTRSPNPG